jgi:cytochrome c peroxidase
MKRLLLLALSIPAWPAALPVPLGLDAYMPVPESNPLTGEKAALGKKLFFDKRLSRDGTISCASCHRPDRAYTDEHAVATGIGGRAGVRRVPRLANRGYGKTFFWDGRAGSIEDQVLQPISNPVEMDSSAEEAASRVGVSQGELRDALASYVRTILSGDSRYDRYLAGDNAALTSIERLGLRLFTGKAGCSSCHVGPNLTDERYHNTGAGRGTDAGRGQITGRGEDHAAFKTPSLRDAARTPPYMHDGSLAAIGEVVDFYDKGGAANPNLDPDIRPLHLTADEKAALAAFLATLNGTVRDGF